MPLVWWIVLGAVYLSIGTMIIRVTVPDLTAEQLQRWGEVQICMNAQQQAEGKQEDTDGQCNQADS